MKFQNFRYVALILASIINIWIGLLFIIVGAHVVGGLTNGDIDQLFGSTSFYMIFFMLLSLVSCAIAFIKNTLGGILISVSAIGLIIFDLDDLHFGQYPLYVLLFSGVALIFFTYGEKWFIKRE